MTSSFLRIHEGNQELKEKLQENKKSYTFPFQLDNFKKQDVLRLKNKKMY